MVAGLLMGDALKEFRYPKICRASQGFPSRTTQTCLVSRVTRYNCITNIEA